MKIEKNHNDDTAKLFQKLMVFIDTVLINAVSSKPEDVNKILVTGLQNIKDVIFSEFTRDNYISNVNNIIAEKMKKKEEKDTTNQEVE